LFKKKNMGGGRLGDVQEHQQSRCCERWDPRRRGYFVVSEAPDGMIWDDETHRYVFV
jgi:hypothetical protein